MGEKKIWFSVFENPFIYSSEKGRVKENNGKKKPGNIVCKNEKDACGWNGRKKKRRKILSKWIEGKREKPSGIKRKKKEKPLEKESQNGFENK